MELLAAVAVSLGALFVLSRWWRARALRQLARASRVVRTDQGDIECATLGSGPAVVVLHGGLGGFDQGLGVGLALLVPGATPGLEHDLEHADRCLRGRFALIAPSRPGYLRTPLASGSTPKQAANLTAALLDELGIARALVVGVSAGGPTALEFAGSHPDRTAALMLVAAITHRHVQPARTTESLAGKLAFARGAGWILDLVYGLALVFARAFPRVLCAQVLRATELLEPAELSSRAERIARSPEQSGWIQNLLRYGYPLSDRKDGLDNDLRQFAALAERPIEGVTSAALAVHGLLDGNVPIAHAELAVRAIPGAELAVDASCGHILWLSDGYPGIQRKALEFLVRHASGASVPS